MSNDNGKDSNHDDNVRQFKDWLGILILVAVLAIMLMAGMESCDNQPPLPYYQDREREK